MTGLAWAAPVLTAQDYGTDKPPPAAVVASALTAEQTAALRAVDIRIAGIEALLPRIDDPDYKAAVASAVQDLKRRRGALEQNFEAGLYDALMHSVISRFQVVALWLAPPRLLPRDEVRAGPKPSGAAGPKDPTRKAGPS